ncbi:MAG: Nicotinate-nucleotide adenylyltransferase [Acidobacteriota bacterium]
MNDVTVSSKRRVGVYGGTFDPLHEGHLQVATALSGAFELDQLLLVPAAIPPHKRGVTISSPYHRVAMLALATAALPRVAISTIELEAPDRPYTIETLGKLQEADQDARLFFIMGADSFRDVTIWREYRKILSDYDVIVAVRPGYVIAAHVSGVTGGPQAGHPTAAALAGHLPPELRDLILDLRGGRRPTTNDLSSKHVYLTDYVSVDISATDVRRASAAGHSLAGLVPLPVADYIAKYQLYQSPL